MCGFFLGLLGAAILFKIGRRMMYGGGCGGGRRRHMRRGGYGRRFSGRWLDWLFERLDTSHGQEKVMREAAREVEDAMRSVKGLGRKHKRDLADIIRGNDFDHEAVGETWTEQDQALEKVRMSIVTALQKVHEVLEPRQREQLADMLEGAWR